MSTPNAIVAKPEKVHLYFLWPIPEQRLVIGQIHIIPLREHHPVMLKTWTRENANILTLYPCSNPRFPRQRRGLLASALCVAEHRRWSSGHHRHHIKQTGDSRRYALRRCATSPEKHPIKTFFVRENHQWIPRSTRLCRFLVRTVTLNGKVKIKNSQIQRVSRTKSAQFAKHIPV